jgi:hypothetical protein
MPRIARGTSFAVLQLFFDIFAGEQDRGNCLPPLPRAGFTAITVSNALWKAKQTSWRALAPKIQKREHHQKMPRAFFEWGI